MSNIIAFALLTIIVGTQKMSFQFIHSKSDDGTTFFSLIG